MSTAFNLAVELRDFIFNHPNTPEDTGNLKDRGVLDSNPIQLTPTLIGVRVGGVDRAPYVGFLEYGTRYSRKHVGWLAGEYKEFAEIIAQRYGGRIG